MSKLKKVAFAFLSFMPATALGTLCVMTLYVLWNVANIELPEESDVDILRWVIQASIILSILGIVVFLIEIALRSEMPPNRKWLWGLGILVFSVIVMPMYYWMVVHVDKSGNEIENDTSVPEIDPFQ